MCGIVGYCQSDRHDFQRITSSMADAVEHRGPDDSGVWWDESVGIAFGFRRLAILDLTPEGRQPMHSQSGRYVIVFNGEIYNFLDLKTELVRKGNRFRGGSDTEVILAAFETWGVEKSVLKFNGMFAFAVWDSKEQELFLVRDRIGKKPLFYGWCNGCFFFSSELKAIRRHPKFVPEVDRGALRQYMQRGYIPFPLSIYRYIYKLIPGSYLKISKDGLTRRPTNFTPYLCGAGGNGPVPYWDLMEAAIKSQANPFQGDENEAVEELEKLLCDATKKRMIADVPLGAFLSGGIDSSLIVAIMQSKHRDPVKTFTIGFDEADYNEAQFARKIAEYLKTDHTEFYLTSDEGLQIVPLLPNMFDEPLADASQIPSFLVSRLSRRDVTVALCGDGGDELFVGYNRYIWPQQILFRLGLMPQYLRRTLSRMGLGLSPSRRNQLAGILAKFTPHAIRPRRPGESLEKLLRIISAQDADDLYASLTTYWPADCVLGEESSRPQYSMENMQMLSDFLMRSMFLDLGGYLPEDLLAKVDRASMAASLEVRAPLLDYRIIEFAASIPSLIRAKNGEKKYLLRSLLSRYIPRELFERPKMGFSVPIGRWLHGPLKGWAEDLLDESRLKAEGFFDQELVSSRWEEQLRGVRNWQNELWTVLSFQAWNQAQRKTW